MGFGFKFDRDRVDILNLCFFVGNHVCDDTRGQPERLPALGEWNLERLDGRFDGCDVDSLLVPTRSEIERSGSRLGSRGNVFPTHLPRVLPLRAARIAVREHRKTDTPPRTRAWGRGGEKLKDLETRRRR